MTTRPEGEPWTRISSVLAEAAGEDESRAFDAAAEATAAQMRGIRRDWSGRPTCTWSMAEELLASLRAERARVAAANEARAIAVAQATLATLPRGIPAEMVPEGLSAGELMMLSDPMVPPSRRKSVLEEMLERRPAGGDVEVVVHPLRQETSWQ